MTDFASTERQDLIKRAIPPAPSQDDLASLLRLTIHDLGPIHLGVLLCAALRVCPAISPRLVHNALNNLVVAAQVRVSSTGCYYTP